MSLYMKVGKVLSPQGIRGELFLFVFSGDAFWLDEIDHIVLSKTDSDEPIEMPGSRYQIQSYRPHKKEGKQGYVVSLADVDSRDLAEELSKTFAYVSEKYMSSSDTSGEELILRELLQYKVIDKILGDVGVVVGFSGTQMQDLIEVEYMGNQYYIPFVDQLVPEIDHERKVIHTELPKGLVPEGK